MASTLPAVAGATPREGRVAGWSKDLTAGEPADGARRRGEGCDDEGAPEISAAERTRKRCGPSVFESCLKSKDPRNRIVSYKVPVPSLDVELVSSALQADEQKQGYKYTHAAPKALSARFHKRMPERGQNSKLCRPEVRHAQPFDLPVRFNEATLARMFMAVDIDGNGTVSQRELMLALRKSKELRHLFCHMHDVAFGNEKPDQLATVGVMRSLKQHSARGRLELASHLATHQDREEEKKMYSQRVKAELRRLQTVFKDLDEDGSGELDFDEFVEFFRRAGLLLEYSTGHDVLQEVLDEKFLANVVGRRKASNAGLPDSPTERASATARASMGELWAEQSGSFEGKPVTTDRAEKQSCWPSSPGTASTRAPTAVTAGGPL